MPTATIAAPPASSWPIARQAAARGDPQVRRRDRRARRGARRPSSSRSRGRRDTPDRISQRVRPSSSARTTNHSAATQHRMSSASGLLWREIATVIGVVASTRPATKPAARPNRRRDEVVDERDGRDAHQRLRHEQAQRVEAEDLDERDLDPLRERRLVDRHHPGLVERAVEERVPARGHRADRGAVVLVRPAVAAERPEVQEARRGRAARRAPGAGAGGRAPAPGNARGRRSSGGEERRRSTSAG